MTWPRARAKPLDAICFLEQSIQFFGMFPLDRFEEYAFLPPDVVVKEPTKSLHHRRIRGRRFGLSGASFGEFSQRTMLG